MTLPLAWSKDAAAKPSVLNILLFSFVCYKLSATQLQEVQRRNNFFCMSGSDLYEQHRIQDAHNKYPHWSFRINKLKQATDPVQDWFVAKLLLFFLGLIWVFSSNCRCLQISPVVNVCVACPSLPSLRGPAVFWWQKVYFGWKWVLVHVGGFSTDFSGEASVSLFVCQTVQRIHLLAFGFPVLWNLYCYPPFFLLWLGFWPGVILFDCFSQRSSASYFLQVEIIYYLSI